jgi:predicted RNA-binding protein
MKYWIATISREHALRGVEGGFTQINHGKEAPLKRMKKDDWLLVYSSKQSMDREEKCQSFTAIGRVLDDEIYRFRMREDFMPYRRKVNYFSCTETSILPYIDELEFIPNKKSWGFPFRFGFFEISEHDFELIRSKMLENDKN